MCYVDKGSGELVSNAHRVTYLRVLNHGIPPLRVVPTGGQFNLANSRALSRPLYISLIHKRVAESFNYNSADKTIDFLQFSNRKELQKPKTRSKTVINSQKGCQVIQEYFSCS